VSFSVISFARKSLVIDISLIFWTVGNIVFPSVVSSVTYVVGQGEEFIQYHASQQGLAHSATPVPWTQLAVIARRSMCSFPWRAPKSSLLMVASCTVISDWTGKSHILMFNL
jgi:hypothetical protein